MNRMEAALWVILPGFVAVASGLLAWFVMQSRMDVKLAEQRESLAEARGQMKAEKEAMEISLKAAVRVAEETARQHAFDKFLGELEVETRGHNTTEKHKRAQKNHTNT